MKSSVEKCSQEDLLLNKHKRVIIMIKSNSEILNLLFMNEMNQIVQKYNSLDD